MSTRKVSIGFRPLDIAVLAYLSIQSSLLLIFGGNLPGLVPVLGFRIPQRPLILLFYIVSAAITMIAVVTPYDRNRKFRLAMRLTYPLFLFTFLYEVLRDQIFMIFRYPFDSQIVGLEKLVFGGDPAFILQPYMEIWLNELLNFGYVSYYFLIPAAAIILAWKSRWESLEKMVTAVSISFYVSYLIFILYPVVGPRFFLADNYYLPMIGHFFTNFALAAVSIGGHYGGAMPSSHCAVAFAAVVIIAVEFKKLRFPFITILFLLCMGTIYGRYHYFTDVIAGLILGFISLLLSERWLKYFFVNDSGGQAAADIAKSEGPKSHEYGTADK